MKELSHKIWQNLICLTAIITVTSVLVAVDILHIAVSILAAIACYPFARKLWESATKLYRHPIRLLLKNLPKIGFTTEDIEWEEDDKLIRIHGKFLEQDFWIAAEDEHAHIRIVEEPLFALETSDPIIPRVLEALNDINAERANINVFITEPNQYDLRVVYTQSQPIIPTFDTVGYLESLLGRMIMRQFDLKKAMEKDRPYMSQRQSTVGFNITHEPDQPADEEPMTPAATATQIA